MSTRIVHGLIAAAAALLLVLLLLRAVLTVDPYFDSFDYHLPFAAHTTGLCPDTCFQMRGHYETAYAGFPKLFYRMQGLAWRITGTAQDVDVLNVGALGLFCLFLYRWFQVPPAWTFCALLAVPLVQIHATSSYIDLPVNLAAAAAILALYVFARSPETFDWRRLAVLGACLAFAANSKPQMIGVVVPVGGLFAAAGTAMLMRGRRVGPFVPDRLASWLGFACLLVAAGATVAASAISNAAHHGNPFYPVRIEILGHVFPGPWSVDGGELSVAATWQAVPSPLRWVASVLEVGAYGYRQVPWTFDQAYCETALAWKDCWRPNTASFRMGGYFVPYVLALATFLAWRLGSRRIRDRHLIASVLLGATILASVLPRSHELRVYMFWIIMLVAVCLITVFDPACSPPGQARRASALLGSVVLVALAAMLSMTQARYVNPLGPSLQTLVDTLGIKTRVAAIPDHAQVCLDPGWQPFAFLFAPVFHPGRSYTVIDGHADTCDSIIAASPGAP